MSKSGDMVIKKRRMARDSWSRIISREFTHAPIRQAPFGGVMGLLRFTKVSEPLKVMVGDRLVQVVGSGYYWLQIAPEGEHWWLTAMFDPSLRPLEYYFDVTLENHLDGGESYFDDLFLDVVISPDGSPYLLDEDELDIALSEGVITKEQHTLSHRIADSILAEFPMKINLLEKFCRQSIRQLSH